jgi:cytochrome c-type biogenesis protein CcmH/NrfG
LLFSKPLPRSEVRAAVQRDQMLSEAARQKVLALTERFQEEVDPEKYHAAAWPVIRRPYANAPTSQFALAQMKAACQLAPDNATYRLALGVAQYRLGKFQKDQYPSALAALTRCDQDSPATLAFLAMTRHQLGQKDQARATLTRLQGIMAKRASDASAEAGSFLREAVELIEGKLPRRSP